MCAQDTKQQKKDSLDLTKAGKEYYARFPDLMRTIQVGLADYLYHAQQYTSALPRVRTRSVSGETGKLRAICMHRCVAAVTLQTSGFQQAKLQDLVSAYLLAYAILTNKSGNEWYNCVNAAFQEQKTNNSTFLIQSLSDWTNVLKSTCVILLQQLEGKDISSAQAEIEKKAAVMQKLFNSGVAGQEALLYKILGVQEACAKIAGNQLLLKEEYDKKDAENVKKSTHSV
ncbi:MAG: hypothetical protein M1561_05225 [Gammaproteobacteria bacterium]|nr:hypothetical protein [Gammaproteobacteria bacterium]